MLRGIGVAAKITGLLGACLGFVLTVTVMAMAQTSTLETSQQHRMTVGAD